MVKDEPKSLRCGILAVVNEVGEKYFTINISKMKESSTLEKEKISKYFSEKNKFHSLEKEYIEIFTGPQDEYEVISEENKKEMIDKIINLADSINNGTLDSNIKNKLFNEK